MLEVLELIDLMVVLGDGFVFGGESGVEGGYLGVELLEL